MAPRHEPCSSPCCPPCRCISSRPLSPASRARGARSYCHAGRSLINLVRTNVKRWDGRSAGSGNDHTLQVENSRCYVIHDNVQGCLLHCHTQFRRISYARPGQGKHIPYLWCHGDHDWTSKSRRKGEYASRLPPYLWRSDETSGRPSTGCDVSSRIL